MSKVDGRFLVLEFSASIKASISRDFRPTRLTICRHTSSLYAAFASLTKCNCPGIDIQMRDI